MWKPMLCRRADKPRNGSFSQFHPRPCFRSGGLPEVDLFASVESALLPRYFSIHKGDKAAWGFDALHHQWEFSLMYAFPPQQLILQTLAKLTEASGTLILITPCWPESAWLGEVIALSVSPPVLLPLPALQQQETRDLRNLQLTGWQLCTSGSPSLWWRGKLLSSSQDPSISPLNRPIAQLGVHGLHGVQSMSWTQF